MSIFIFCYHSVITNGCQDTLPATAFLYHSLFFSDLFNFFRQQKNPRNTRFLGYLTFGHKLSYDNKSIFRLYYSMMVATRPEPTVLPPSRYQNDVLQRLNGYFSFILCGKMLIFRCVRVVFGNFVIMVLSHSFKPSIDSLSLLILFS